MSKMEQRLEEMGYSLPQAPAPAANYMPYVRIGPLIQLAGVAPSKDGRYAVIGKVGGELSIDDGRFAAQLCALNLVANLKLACDGDLDRVQRIMMVRGFVNATEAFEHVPQVMDGASDLLVDLFGPQIGRHARTSIGCQTLPGRVAVELDALVYAPGDDSSSFAL